MGMHSWLVSAVLCHDIFVMTIWFWSYEIHQTWNTLLSVTSFAVAVLCLISPIYLFYGMWGLLGLPPICLLKIIKFKRCPLGHPQPSQWLKWPHQLFIENHLQSRLIGDDANGNHPWTSPPSPGGGAVRQWTSWVIHRLSELWTSQS
jgi:hypothetical protein